MSRRIPRRAPRIRSSSCSSTTSQPKKSTRVDVRDGKPFDNSVVGHYVYRVAWSADGTELLFNRTNRRQNVLELAAANPDTGATRVVIREEWPTGWVENSPAMTFLTDGRRFIWESERNGWSNLYLYDLSGKLIAPLTAHTGFEVGALVKVDEAAGLLFYTARDGDNYMKLQLHRVGLDGKEHARLTDPAFNHTVGGCMGDAPGGRGGGAAARVRRRRLRHLAGQRLLRRRLPDPRHAAGDASGRRDRQGRRRAREERPHEVHATGVQAGRAVHLPGGRRQDQAARADAVSFQLRSGEEVSRPRLGLRRTGVRRQHRARNVRGAEPDRRVRVPRSQPRLAQRVRPGQAACSTTST